MLESLLGYIVEVSSGLGITLSVFAMTLLISLPLGILIAVCRLSKNKIICNIAKLYIWVLRGTPLMLQIALVFFGLPSVGIVFDRLPAAYLACGLNYAAYFGEIFRSGIQSIERGQREAANILGFKTVQFYRFILLPQAIKRTLPAIGNEVITLIKDTSLVYVVAVNDILRVAKGAGGRDANTLLAYVAAGLLYLGMTYLITRLFEVIEKKVQYEE